MTAPVQHGNFGHVTGRMAPLSLAQYTWLSWYRTIWLWLPAQHPLARTHLTIRTNNPWLDIRSRAYSSLYVCNGRGTEEDDCWRRWKREERIDGQKRLAGTFPREGAGQTTRILYLASWVCCVNGRCATLPVSQSLNHQNEFETVIIKWENHVVYL